MYLVIWAGWVHCFPVEDFVVCACVFEVFGVFGLLILVLGSVWLWVGLAVWVSLYL